MSIVVRLTPASLTAQKYDEAHARVEESLGWPADGLDYHVCFGSEGNLRVSEIWDSREQFEAFGELLMPVLAEPGYSFRVSRRCSRSTISIGASRPDEVMGCGVGVASFASRFARPSPPVASRWVF